MSTRPDLWFSYNAVQGPKTCSQMPIYTLSVVLDDSAWKGITDVRLVIVRKPRETDPEIHLQECNTQEPFHKWAHYHLNPPRNLPKPNPMNRERSTFVRRQGNRKIQTSDSHVAPNPLYLVLEYAMPDDKRHPDFRFGVFSLRPVRVISLRDISPQLRILFDRRYRVSATNRSIYLVLLSTNLRPNDFKIYSDLSILNSYSIRVLPHDRGKRCLIDALPTPLITKIINTAINNYDSRWAQQVLNYGLVQKSWTHVLELFWAQIGYGHGYVANPDGLANAILHRPEMGKYLIRHSADLISEYTLSEEIYVKAHSSLLRAATSVKELHLNARCLSAVKTILPTLNSVVKLDCYLYDRSRGANCSTPELQELIAGWTNLEEVTMAFANPASKDAQTANTATLPTPKYALKSFVSGTGNLSGPDLLHFFSSKPQRVSYIRLYAVDGLSHDDFCYLFGLTAPTLVTLHVELCYLADRDNLPEHRALDLHLPKMTSIKDVVIQGDLATPLAITSKPGVRSGNIAILNPSSSAYLLPGQQDGGVPLLSTVLDSSWSKLEFKFSNSHRLATCREFCEELGALMHGKNKNVRAEVRDFMSDYPQIRIQMYC